MEQLAVKYFPQRDNDNNPMGTCCPTCAAMALEFKNFDTEYLMAVVHSTGARQIEDALTKLTPNYADFYKLEHTIDTHFMRGDYQYTGVKNLTHEGIKQEIDNLYPVEIVICIGATLHCVLVVGYDNDKYYMHDPYGSFIEGYPKFDELGNAKAFKDGQYAEYSYSMLWKGEPEKYGYGWNSIPRGRLAYIVGGDKTPCLLIHADKVKEV